MVKMSQQLLGIFQECMTMMDLKFAVFIITQMICIHPLDMVFVA